MLCNCWIFVDKYTRKNKELQQVVGIPEGYVVKDDIETGYANVIPLWNFGMNYWYSEPGEVSVHEVIETLVGFHGDILFFEGVE